MKKIVKSGFFCFFVAIFILPSFVFSQSYDFYVDGNYGGNEEGTKDKPFNKISDAIDASGFNSKIFIKRGNYNEKISIKKGVSLFGEDRSEVVLLGGVEMEDGSSIRNLTVEGGWTAVWVRSNANAEISNCDVRKFGKMGINAAVGSGKVIVKNSSIYRGEGKGIYIEQGRKIEISANNIYGNSEEGIDIRAKVDGLIKANNIYGNGESGIEIVVGSSNVMISGNKIKQNGASGIASQFYQENKKTGKLNIKGNVITMNKKYGLDCNLPSGGKPTSSYWSDSVNLVDNDLTGNKIKSINDFCNIIDVIDEIEEDVANRTDDKEIGLKSKAELSEKNFLVDEDIKRDEAIWENAEAISDYQDVLEKKLNEQIDRINATNRLWIFFFGINSESLGFIKGEIEIIKEQIDTIKNDFNKAKNEETKAGLQALMERMEKKSNDLEIFVKEKEKKVGIFGWLFKLLKN